MGEGFCVSDYHHGTDLDSRSAGVSQLSRYTGIHLYYICGIPSESNIKYGISIECNTNTNPGIDTLLMIINFFIGNGYFHYVYLSIEASESVLIIG